MSRAASAAGRPPVSRRGASAAAALVLAAGAVCGLLVPAPVAEARVPADQPLVALLQGHVARSAPDVHARRIGAVAARRPLTGRRTVLPLLARATSRDGRSWVRVRLPGRPSGHTGWLPADHIGRSSTGWRISVALGARMVTVHHVGRVVRRFKAVVGKPSTPTPRGRFFVEEAVELPSGTAGGPFALASSARSHVLQEFDGGPGQIALHGTDGLPGALGTAASHGCIRISTRAITWLARRIGAGVPLTVTR